MFISFSGKTAELLHVAKHLPASVTVMALTGHPDAQKCPVLVQERLHGHNELHGHKEMGELNSKSILLPAPIHESEESTFGVSAPTTSTTVAIAIGDMLALAVADQVHREKAGAVFKRNHPGGTIGAEARK